MFSYTLHAKCDICQRTFNHAPKDIALNGNLAMIIPVGWRHVLIEPKPEMHLLICEDHVEKIGLVPAAPKDTAVPAEVVS